MKNKKLQLNKETIAQLNSNEMNNIKGGSSLPCWRFVYGVACLGQAIVVAGVDNSWFACDPNKTVSCVADVNGCLLPEVVIHG